MALWVTYDNLCAIVGADAALRLSKALGGLDLWVPGTVNKTHTLTMIMGPQPAEKLCLAYGGSEIMVPSRRKKPSRAKEVATLLERGESASRIALQLGLTVRYVRHLAARARAMRS